MHPLPIITAILSQLSLWQQTLPGTCIMFSLASGTVLDLLRIYFDREGTWHLQWPAMSCSATPVWFSWRSFSQTGWCMSFRSSFIYSICHSIYSSVSSPSHPSAHLFASPWRRNTISNGIPSIGTADSPSSSSSSPSLSSQSSVTSVSLFLVL